MFSLSKMFKSTMPRSWVLSNQYVDNLHLSNVEDYDTVSKRIWGRELDPISMDEVIDLAWKAHPKIVGWTREHVKRTLGNYKYVDLEVDGKFCYIKLVGLESRIRDKKLNKLFE